MSSLEQTPAQTIEGLKQELTAALAQRAIIDEQIVAIRNALQGVNLGIEFQKTVLANGQNN